MKALVQVSGGLDSAAALIWAVRRYGCWGQVRGVFYAYNQPYMESERRAVEWLTKMVAVKVSTVVLPLGIQSTTRIKEYVPFRNLVMTAHSINLAAVGGDNYVVVGSKSAFVRPDDPYSFRDSCLGFFTDLNDLTSRIAEPDTRAPMIQTPVMGWSKAMIVDFIRSEGIDPDRLWTCYGPGPNPCGKCHHCHEYKNAKERLSHD